MTAGSRNKPLDRSELLRKALLLIKRHYHAQAPKAELPVLETTLFAICLENATPADAEAAYASLHNRFHDMNEVRVSSIYELQAIFAGMVQSEWKALRIRNVLHYVFENTYTFDWDSLKRKTLDLAQKTLSKVKALSPFVRSYVLQHSLSCHLLPVDDRMHACLQWLGLVDRDLTADKGADSLKSLVRKADASHVCFLIRCLATDPKYIPVFQAGAGALTDDPVQRLETLFSQGPSAFLKRLAKANTKALAEAAKAKAKEKPASRGVSGKTKPTAKTAASKSSASRTPAKSVKKKSR